MPRKKTKIVAIQSGGDWADAGCDHLIVPADLDLKTEWKLYAKATGIDPDAPFPFSQWLIKKVGAQEDAIEVFDG